MKTRRAVLDAAFRERARAIGILQCCLCAYPLELLPTSTGHAPDCPAHYMVLEYERLEAQRAAGGA